MGFSTSVAACFLHSYRKRTALGAELMVLSPKDDFPFFGQKRGSQSEPHAFSAKSIPVRLLSATGFFPEKGRQHVFEDFYGYGTYINVAVEAIQSDFEDLEATVAVLSSASDHCLVPFVSTSVLAKEGPAYALRAEGVGAFHAGEAFVVPGKVPYDQQEDGDKASTKRVPNTLRERGPAGQHTFPEGKKADSSARLESEGLWERTRLPIHWGGHFRTASYHDLFVAYRRAARAFGQEGSLLVTSTDVSPLPPPLCNSSSSFLFLTGCGDEKLPQLPMLLFDVATYTELGDIDDGYGANGGLLEWVENARARGMSVEMQEWSSLYTTTPLHMRGNPNSMSIYAQGVAASFTKSCGHKCTVQTPAGILRWDASKADGALAMHVPFPFLESPRSTVQMLRGTEQQDLDRLWLFNTNFRETVLVEVQRQQQQGEQRAHTDTSDTASAWQWHVLLDEDVEIRVQSALRAITRFSFIQMVPSLTAIQVSRKLALASTPDLPASASEAGAPSGSANIKSELIQVAAVICVYDDAEFLNDVIVSVFSVVQHIVVLVGLQPWKVQAQVY
jgi:hypothetical protein